MIRALKGTIIRFTATGFVLEVNGVGYDLHATAALSSSFEIDQAVAVSTYYHQGQDSVALFAFADESERAWFTELLSVSGVGPRTALGCLERGTAALQAAMEAGDLTFFTAVPRLGKKTAQKILVDLRGKLVETGTDQNHVWRDVRQTLINMGYHGADIDKVLQGLDHGISEAEALKKVIQELS